MSSRLSAYFSRRSLALTIVATTLILNAWLDYRLILRNPSELEAQATRILKWALPNYTPRFSPNTKLNLLKRRLTLYDVEFHEKGKPDRILFKVPELEVRSTPLFDRFFLKAKRPRMLLRIDKDGNPNLPEGGGGTKRLLVELEIEVEKGRVLIINDFEGSHSEVLIDNIGTLPGRPIKLQQDLSAEGALACYVGALVEYPDGELTRAEVEQSYRAFTKSIAGTRRTLSHHVIPRLQFDIAHTAGGPVRIGAGGVVQISKALRGLIPVNFQQDVWDLIGIRGGQVKLGARVQLSEEGAHVGVSLRPHKAQIKPKGFPIEVNDISAGRFEITVAKPDGQPPRFLGVFWEGVEAAIGKPGEGRWGREQGRVRGRGAVFPGGDNEPVTMHLFIEAFELPLTEELRMAFPPDVREIYEMFAPKGLVKNAKVQIFKGAFEKDILVLKSGEEIVGELPPDQVSRLVEDARDRNVLPPNDWVRPLKFKTYHGVVKEFAANEVEQVKREGDVPQISIFVPELAGTLSASFVGPKDHVTGVRSGVPIRVENLHGHFSLSENANVELEVEGALAVGGTARVKAMVMHGDLISVDIAAKKVPVGTGLIDALPGKSREVLKPFNLSGGTADVRIKVEKPQPKAAIQPTIYADLHRVSVQHDEFPMPLVADGLVKVVPRFETAEQDDPSRVDLGLNVKLSGKGLVAGVVSGTLAIPSQQPKVGIVFKGNLDVAAKRLDTAHVPRDKLFKEVLAQLRPSGVVRGLRARIRTPSDLEARGRGRDLGVVLEAFPYPILVDRFAVKVEGDRIGLEQVEGRSRKRGKFSVRGHLIVPEPATEDANPPLDLDLRMTYDDLLVEPKLVAALPEGVRASLQRMDPTGRMTGSLHLRLKPKRPTYMKGSLQIEGGQVTLHKLDKNLRNTKDEPLKQLKGKIELSSDRVEFYEFKGSFAGSPAHLTSGTLELDTAKNELKAFSMTAFLPRIAVNQKTRRLAGREATEGFYKDFSPSGHAALTFEVFKKATEEKVHIHLLARPLGMRVVPHALLPLPISRLTGRIKLEDWEPVLIELDGFLDPPVRGYRPPGKGSKRVAPAEVHIRRDLEREERFPGKGKRGRVYHVWLKGLERFRNKTHRRAFEKYLQPNWVKFLNTFDPRGKIDIDAWAYQPITPEGGSDERKAMRWVAELDLHDLGFFLVAKKDPKKKKQGEKPDEPDFARISGRARVQGRLGEFELGSCQGDVRLKRMDWYKQSFLNLTGKFGVKNGTLYLGTHGAPFSAKLYQGDFRGRTEFEFKSGRYRSWFALGLWKGARHGQLQQAMREMNRLGDPEKQAQEKKKRSRQNRGTIPYYGKIFAQVHFSGGGKDIKGQEVPIYGLGDLRLEDANLLDDPALRLLQTTLNSLPFIGGNSTKALPNMHIRFRMGKPGLELRDVELWGNTLRLRGEKGTLSWEDKNAGYLSIDLVLGKSRGGLNRILTWVPFLGYEVRGKLQDGVDVSTLRNPLSSIPWIGQAVEKITKWFTGDDD